jgi:predicted nucleotidyltransferase
MPKDRGRNDERSRIAHFAARIMVEDGVEDYATAKRKAARQAGVPDTRQLPTNEEIDAALRTHQVLFEGETHRERLRELRSRAVKIMRELDEFNPYLTGSVLSGNAGKYADINLQLYVESVKSVQLYLIDRGITHRPGQFRLYCGDEARIAPTFTIEDDVPIELVLLALDDLRRPIRTTADGKPMERARLHVVEALCETT